MSKKKSPEKSQETEVDYKKIAEFSKKLYQDKPKLVEDMSFAIFRSMAFRMLRRGEIVLDEREDTKIAHQLMGKILKNLHDEKGNVIPVALSADHSDELLSKAREYHTSEDLNMAVLLYATYFEHKVNHIVVTACDLKKIRKPTATAMFKTIRRLEEKTGWILEVLVGESLNAATRNTIRDISDYRNYYVHYKHGPYDMTRNKGLRSALEKAETAVSDLDAYRDKHFHHGQEARLDGILAFLRSRVPSRMTPFPERGKSAAGETGDP
jgi:hypothetical protein